MKMFSMLIATAVAMSTLACGGEVVELCGDKIRTETVVVVKTTTVTKTTTVVEVRTATVVVVETTTVTAPEMSMTGTVTTRNRNLGANNIGYPFVPFSSHGFIRSYDMHASMDGVLRRLEAEVQGPGLNPEEFVRACKWSISIEGVATQVPCTVVDGHVVMAHNFHVPEGVMVWVNLYISAYAFAETGTYDLPLSTVIMDDGQGGAAFHVEKGVEVVPEPYYRIQDPVCEALLTNPRNEVTVITVNTPQVGGGVIEIEHGTRGTLVDLNIHSCTSYALYSPWFSATLLRVNRGNPATDGGTGMYNADGTLRRVVVYETLNIRSPSTGRGGNYTTLLDPVSLDIAIHQREFMVEFAGDTSYRLEIDCIDLPVNEEYEVLFGATIPNVVNSANAAFNFRFRCVE